jgi:hypothetical protein
VRGAFYSAASEARKSKPSLPRLAMSGSKKGWVLIQLNQVFLGVLADIYSAPKGRTTSERSGFP